MKKVYGMTKGKIWPIILSFSLPLLGASLIQQLYNTADMIFVGNFIGKEATGAVGASSFLFTCIIGLFTGVSIGVGITVSQKIGSKDFNTASKISHTAITFGIIGGIILTFIGYFSANFLLTLMNTPIEIMTESVLYLKIYFLSILPMILYNIGAGIVRSTGNSKTPFFILIIGGITNVIANYIFIVTFKMGVAGVAIATALSQTLTAIIILNYLFKNNTIIKFRISELKIDFYLLKQILYFGLPAGIQSMLITFSNIIVQYYINGYGGDAVAAYATYYKLENFIWMPIVAIGQANMTFSGQNIGANNYKRVKKGAFISIFLSGGLSVIIAIIILTFSHTFMRIFIKNEEIIYLGSQIAFTTFPFYWLYSILEVLGNSLRGMGYSLVSMYITIICLCGVRISLLYLISKFNLDFKSVAYVYPMTWFFTASIFMIVFLKIINKKIKNSNYNL
ncbi:MATE family efflux transporter [Fusobacterium simiae]|uniref:MATE family efflux transporter n=1 Tax=Fusobacterium simiae TaxID=855 RepID=A0ABT4DH61_FUSSI|nr:MULTISPECIES: MATE family efflux transporter [Fusobacterium]MCY7007916.1 MATE family efflux transporter [Fusobacterium simiae]MDC7956110.1 MATE family efflux transporter [Fusobacterium simiae]